jgi:hypothetical protein
MAAFEREFGRPPRWSTSSGSTASTATTKTRACTDDAARSKPTDPPRGHVPWPFYWYSDVEVVTPITAIGAPTRPRSPRSRMACPPPRCRHRLVERARLAGHRPRDRVARAGAEGHGRHLLHGEGQRHRPDRVQRQRWAPRLQRADGSRSTWSRACRSASRSTPTSVLLEFTSGSGQITLGAMGSSSSTSPTTETDALSFASGRLRPRARSTRSPSEVVRLATGKVALSRRSRAHGARYHANAGVAEQSLAQIVIRCGCTEAAKSRPTGTHATSNRARTRALPKTSASSRSGTGTHCAVCVAVSRLLRGLRPGSVAIHQE